MMDERPATATALYDGHFAAMAGIVGFVLLHLILVLLVPRTLPAMVTGRARLPDAPPEASR